jgi:hypothetical protein
VWTKLGAKSARGVKILHLLLNHRYQRGASIVTSYVAFNDKDKRFHNFAATFAIANRLEPKGILFRIFGKFKGANEAP